MRRKFLSMLLACTLCLSLTVTALTVSLSDDESDTTVNAVSVYADAASSAAVQAENDIITMREIADFLQDKKEHYPLSDEFIERYQQTSGGYLDTAKKAGLSVNKELHEPNQKWHFFDSWLYPSIDDGSLTWDADAKSRVYTKLLCPELLLWIYEASGVDPCKVRDAKKVAEEGKSAKTGVSTIAKNMRACVPWEDIEYAIKNRDVKTQSVSVNSGEGFTVNVTDPSKEIAEVRANNDVLTAANGTTYKFNMPDEEVVVSVTLRDIPAKAAINPSKLTLNVGESVAITAAITPVGTVENASWTVTEGHDVIRITANGNQATVTAMAKGSAKIVLSCNDGLNAECEVTVKDKNDGSGEYVTKYKLSGTSTAQIKSAEAVMAAFKQMEEGNGLVASVEDIAYIYGGGSGGSTKNDTNWKTTDLIKIGTTSYSGELTLKLNASVNRIIITGYVHTTACKVQVGDSNSTDWTTETGDSKTATYSCSDMTIIGKDALENGLPTTIVIDFAETDSLKIANITKSPLYITSIEFAYIEAEQ